MSCLKLQLLTALLTVGVIACGPGDDGGGDDLCESATPATAVLGQGVGGAFLPYGDLEEVPLAVAPQGGFGVTVIIRTTGLVAGTGLTADVQLNVEQGGQLAGEFLQENTALSCRDKDIGGEVRGVVVGFDPDIYKTNDDLIALDGEVVELVVTVTASNGETATVRKSLTIRVGG
jgi:hypothetical protein